VLYIDIDIQEISHVYRKWIVLLTTFMRACVFSPRTLATFI